MTAPRPNSIPRFGEQAWAEQRYPLTLDEWRYLTSCGDAFIEGITLARPDVPPAIKAEKAEACQEREREREREREQRRERELAAARTEAAQLRAELAAARSSAPEPAPSGRASAGRHQAGSDPYHVIPRLAEFERRSGHYSDGTMDGAMALLRHHQADYERMTRTGMYADCRMD